MAMSKEIRSIGLTVVAILAANLIFSKMKQRWGLAGGPTPTDYFSTGAEDFDVYSPYDAVEMVDSPDYAGYAGLGYLKWRRGGLRQAATNPVALRQQAMVEKLTERPKAPMGQRLMLGRRFRARMARG